MATIAATTPKGQSPMTLSSTPTFQTLLATMGQRDLDVHERAAATRCSAAEQSLLGRERLVRAEREQRERMARDPVYGPGRITPAEEAEIALAQSQLVEPDRACAAASLGVEAATRNLQTALARTAGGYGIDPDSRENRRLRDDAAALVRRAEADLRNATDHREAVAREVRAVEADIAARQSARYLFAAHAANVAANEAAARAVRKPDPRPAALAGALHRLRIATGQLKADAR